jgi:hypothetical protein
MSSARLRAFARRIANAIVQREVEIAHEGYDDFRNMKVHRTIVMFVTMANDW